MSFRDYSTALVTGASSGIGEGVVEHFVREGLKVHAVGRNEERLTDLHDRTGCVVHTIDMHDAAALCDVVAPLPVDVLVNSARINRPRSLATATVEDLDALVSVDLGPVLQLTRLVLPGMISRDLGHIVNIGSIAGLHSFPGHAGYHATKAGVHPLCHQLRIDLHGSRVRVTEISPGRTATGIFATTFGGDAEARRSFLDGFATLQVVDIVDAIAFAIAAPWHVNISLIETWSLQFARPETGKRT
jgi:NADP-dependent 3-hydroxy acid dehydrogenase YdfG